MHVIDEQYDGAILGERLEEPAHRPEELLGGAAGDPVRSAATVTATRSDVAANRGHLAVIASRTVSSRAASSSPNA